MFTIDLFEQASRPVTVCFGRMNPPTLGHGQLLKTVADNAANGDYYIFATKTHKLPDNPLPYDVKFKFLQAMFPEYADHMVYNPELKTIMQVAQWLYDKGYTELNFVAGSDRIPEFEKLLKTYNGKGQPGDKGYYVFTNINMISAGDRDPDAEGLSGISASKARAAAIAGNFEDFVAKTGAGKLARPLYDAVREAMGVNEDIAADSESTTSPIHGGNIEEEAAGVGVVATNKKMARNPRYSMSITKDVKPSTPKNMLRAFRLSESKQAESASIPMIKKILPIAKQELKLDKLPKIRIQRHIEVHDGQATFGRFVNGEDTIYVGIADRHPVDVLRTLAHELVHWRQFLDGRIEPGSGETGSPIENEAHAIAGILMRHFNKKYPDAIKLDNIELQESQDYVSNNINYSQTLNPVAWIGDELKPEVRDRLLKISGEFVKYLEVPGFEVLDVVLTGSMANYNWTKFSDFDLHVVTNYSDLECEDLAETFYRAKKELWNNYHDITIGGHEVEMYVEDAATPPVSAGVFSILDNRWIKTPKFDRPEIDKSAVNAKVRDIIKQINVAIDSVDSPDDIQRIKDKLRRMRRAGLDTTGEFSVENLTYKILRNMGILNKMSDIQTKAQDRQLSLPESKKKIKSSRVTVSEQGVTEGLTKQARARKEAESVKAAIERLEQELKDPNPHIDKDDIRRRLETEKRRLELYRDVLDEQGVAEGMSWSALDQGLSIENKMAIFEEYAIRGNLTESIDQDKKDYFISLFELSDSPVKNKKYIVAPLVLVGNRIMPLDNPGIMKFLAQNDSVLVFDTVNGKKTYPSKTLRDLSIFNTFTFASQSSYDKFRTALSLKFDIGLPSIGQEEGVAEGSLNESAYEEAWELISQPVPEIQQFVKQLGLAQDDTTAKQIAPMIDATPDTQLPAASIPKLKNLANKGNDVQTLKAIQQISGRPDAVQQYAKIMQARDAGEGRQRGYNVSGLINSVKSGNYEAPVLLKLATGTYVIGGRTRLYAALALGIPAKVKIISGSTFAKQGQQGVAEGSLNEIYKMPPTKNSSQGMTIWAYNDALEKKSPILYKDNNVIIFKANEDLLRYIILQDGVPVLYIGLSKFLDGYKSGTVATEIAGRGKGLAQKAYLNASDILGVPIYSDTTQTDASRLGIWNKLIQQYPDRIVGYDQKTNKNLPLSLTDKGPTVNQNQPIYVDRNKKDTNKPITPNQRYRTRILKLLPKKQGVAEGSLNEFAPRRNNRDNNSPRWYNDREIAAIVGRGWIDELGAKLNSDEFDYPELMHISFFNDMQQEEMIDLAQDWLEDHGYKVRINDLRNNRDFNNRDWLIQGNFVDPDNNVSEGWSEKYKKSINCSRPRGFSQRAHCQGRKKK